MEFGLSALRFNLCFLTRGSEVLLINRNKSPLMGLWNGVGGKIEPGETPYESALREIQEETGLFPMRLRFAGIVTWVNEGVVNGGMYIYIGEAEGDTLLQDSDEGILAWKPVDWAVHPDNEGTAGHMKYFLPPMLEGIAPLEHRCEFINGQLTGCSTHPIVSALPQGTAS